jgi:hypothetical protein
LLQAIDLAAWLFCERGEHVGGSVHPLEVGASPPYPALVPIVAAKLASPGMIIKTPPRRATSVAKHFSWRISAKWDGLT